MTRSIAQAQPHTVEFLLNIIPTSVVSAFAENMLLQVLFFAVLFGRGSVNLLGNCVATLVVARWEGQLDADRMRNVLRGEEVEPIDDPAERKEPAASTS